MQRDCIDLGYKICGNPPNVFQVKIICELLPPTHKHTQIKPYYQYSEINQLKLLGKMNSNKGTFNSIIRKSISLGKCDGSTVGYVCKIWYCQSTQFHFTHFAAFSQLSSTHFLVVDRFLCGNQSAVIPHIIFHNQFLFGRTREYTRSQFRVLPEEFSVLKMTFNSFEISFLHFNFLLFLCCAAKCLFHVQNFNSNVIWAAGGKIDESSERPNAVCMEI